MIKKHTQESKIDCKCTTWKWHTKSLWHENAGPANGRPDKM